MSDSIKRARDPDLLDALDAHERTKLKRTVWRAVREGRSPLEPSRVGGRWDLGGLRSGCDVLYTALDADGAIAELEYHLSQQPVFPSRIRSSLHSIDVRASKVITLPTLDDLVALGVDRTRYREPLYERTQEIGDAAAFLGCDALIVPSARWDGSNLVLFFDALEAYALDIFGEPISLDWDNWRREQAKRRLKLRSVPS